MGPALPDRETEYWAEKGKHMAESTNPAGQGRFRPLILTFLLTSLVWIVVLGGLLFLARRPEPATFEITAPPATATPVPTATATPTPTPSPLQVDVDGGVRQPGRKHIDRAA